MPRRWETFVVLEWRSKLTRKIRDCVRQRGSTRMHYLSPLLRKLLSRVTKHCILERKRKRDIWISNRGARSFCSVKETKREKKCPQQVPRTRALRAARVHFQKIFEFDRSFPSGWYCSCERLLPARRYHLSGNENGAPYFWIIITSQLAPCVSLSLELRVTAGRGCACDDWSLLNSYLLHIVGWCPPMIITKWSVGIILNLI